MQSASIKIYLGIPMPAIELLEDDGNKGKSRRALYDVLDDICASSSQLQFRFGDGACKPTIKLLKNIARDSVRKNKYLSLKTMKRCEVLLFSTRIPQKFYESVYASSPENSRKTFSLRDCFLAMSREDFGKQVSDLLVMANVARVGSIELAESAVVVNGELVAYAGLPEMCGYGLQKAGEVAKKMGWPKLHNLKVQMVWNWAMQHAEMFDAFDGTSTGRAVNAFSRIFQRTTADEPMQLFWALVGLEALYVAGKAELLQQVREKSQVLLGPQEAFKKKITKMYEFRSRFVHGDLDFPGLYMVGDARDCVAKYGDDLSEAISVACAVLVATLQEIIRRNWDGLSFRYAVENVSPKGERAEQSSRS